MDYRNRLRKYSNASTIKCCGGSTLRQALLKTTRDGACEFANVSEDYKALGVALILILNAAARWEMERRYRVGRRVPENTLRASANRHESARFG